MDLHSIVGYPGGTRKVRGQSWFLGLEREGGKKNDSAFFRGDEILNENH